MYKSQKLAAILSVPNVSFNILVFNKSWTGDVAKDNKIVEPKLKNKKHKGVCWWPLERSKMHFAILLINFHHCCNTSIRNKWVIDCLGNILYNKYFQCFYTHISVKLMSLTLLMSSWIKPMQRNNLDNIVVSWFMFERNWLDSKNLRGVKRIIINSFNESALALRRAQ